MIRLTVLVLSLFLVTGCTEATQVKVCHDASVAIKVATIAKPHLNQKEIDATNVLIASLSTNCMPASKVTP